MLLPVPPLEDPSLKVWLEFFARKHTEEKEHLELVEKTLIHPTSGLVARLAALEGWKTIVLWIMMPLFLLLVAVFGTLVTIHLQN